jgi:hypothetical protein
MPSPERLIIEKMFRIPDRDGRDVDFILNKEQADFDENLTGRDIIAKARQMGFSTYVLALFLARCLAYRNRRAIIISHTTDATQKLLGRIHYMIKHMKGAQPQLKYANQNYITFEKMDSSIYVGTANSADFGVGDTVTDLHCSEVSRWANPAPLLSGLFQTVPASGTIILESTGRGTGNYFHRQALKAAEGDPDGFKLHFFNWLHRKEYRKDVGPEEAAVLLANLNEEFQEEFYVKHYRLTAGQIKWRRQKIVELDFDLQQFKEQYPCSLEECFQSSGSGFFPFVNYGPSDDWLKQDIWTMKLKDHPKPGCIYAAGVDIGGGVGLDPSVLTIFEVETGEQVLEYVNKRKTPAEFANTVAELCKPFNAYVNFERNNHGYGFGDRFIDLYNRALIHRTKRFGKPKAGTTVGEFERLRDWGSFTSHLTKPYKLGKMRTAFKDGTAVIHSMGCQLECNSFVERENGEIEAAAGCYDDRVMAAALAIEVFPKAMLVGKSAMEREKKARGPRTADIFRVDSLIKELEGRHKDSSGSVPIRSGLSIEWEGQLR